MEQLQKGTYLNLKARFFALYWGQKVLKKDIEGCQNRKRNLVEPKKSKAGTFILGQIDKAIEKSNLEQQIEKLESDKAELLEALEKAQNELLQFKSAFGQGSELIPEIESLIQKHKQ